MLIADIPTTRVAVKAIKRVLPVRPLLCQYQRRVSCTALLCNWPPCVPYDHPTIFSLNKCIYNTHRDTDSQTCFLQQKQTVLKQNYYLECAECDGHESLQRMKIWKRKRRERKREVKLMGLIYNMTLWLGLSLAFPQTNICRERKRERECVWVSVYLSEFFWFGTRSLRFWVRVWLWRFDENTLVCFCEGEDIPLTFFLFSFGNKGNVLS